MMYAISVFKKKESLIFNHHTQKEREIWLDALKVFSSFMIVLIHSSGDIYSYAFAHSDELWNKTLWINAVPRFAVPCFLMITGVLVLDNKYSYGKDLFRRVYRILLPLLIWSSLYVFARKLIWGGDENLILELLKIPFKHQNGSLWYGYQLVWLYLGMPFWQFLYQGLSLEERWYFVLFTLGIPGILTMVGELSLLGVPEYLPFASINPLVCYVGVLFLGKILYSIIQEEKNKQMVLIKGILLSAIGLSMMILSSSYVSYALDKPVHIFFSEVRLAGIIYGSGIFLMFGSVRDIIKKLPKSIRYALQSISKVSLGIYFSHNLIIWIIPEMTIAGFFISKNSGSISQLLICVMIYYIFSIISSLLMLNLPGLKRLVI